MADARIIEVCDEVVAYLQTTWGDAQTTITREYLPDFFTHEFTGPAVYVFPASYSQTDIVTRASDEISNRVSVVFAEKYTDAGKPTTAWIDARVRTVEQKIYKPLGDHRTEAISGLWPETAEVLSVYDYDFLQGASLFLSEVEIDLREVVEG